MEWNYITMILNPALFYFPKAFSKPRNYFISDYIIMHDLI